MARSCKECFKDIGFLFKFIELILSLLLYILKFFGYHVRDNIFLLLASTFCTSAYQFSIPTFVMFVIYILEPFPDKLYELIITIGGACCSGLAAIFLLLTLLVDFDSANDAYSEYYANGSDNETEGGQVEDMSHNNWILFTLIVALFFSLMVAYILDAIINGAGRKVKGITSSDAQKSEPDLE